MEADCLTDAEAKHYAEIGLTADGVCRKTFVPDQIKGESDREFTFVISTGAVDRDNDTIKADGWDLANYRKNPVVLFGHRSDIPPIAKAVTVTKTSGVLKARVQFPEPGIYDLADTVHGLVKGGFMNATSVGFKPKRDKYSWNEERGGIDFEEQELLEFSLVPVPSNPQALMELAKDFAGAKTAGVDLQPIRKAMDLADLAIKDQVDYRTESSTNLVLNWQSEKAGRRLSSKTEASLRSAHKSASEAVEHLSSVLDVAEEQMDDDKSTPTEPKVVLYVTPSPAPEPFAVNPKDVKAAVMAAVSEAVQSAINRARGRLD